MTAPMYEIHPLDCRLAMSMLMEANSVDSVVTDPPYDLTSIVKRFGGKNAAPAKHGTDGAFARLSGGFMGKQWDGTGVAFDPATWAEVYRVLKPGGYLLAFGGTRTYHRMVCAIEDAGFEIRDCIQWLYGSGFPKSHNLPGGLGTALKPAYEPIVVARKPLDGTVAHNVQTWGTGALNIDASRVPSEQGDEPVSWDTPRGGIRLPNAAATGSLMRSGLGRWPANVIHDGSDEVLAGFPDAKGQIAAARTDGSYQSNRVFGALRHGTKMPEPRVDSDTSAARFFYCAKASKADRNSGGVTSTHPTVKPTDLMRYLVRLVTPPGGLVLDPFTGSGSTGKAAILEGFRFVGCEMTDEYLPIIRARLDHAVNSRYGSSS